MFKFSVRVSMCMWYLVLVVVIFVSEVEEEKIKGKIFFIRF